MDPRPEANHSEQAVNHTPTEQEVSIPVIREELHIASRIELTGEVNIRKQVAYEEEEIVLQELERHYEIERIPVNAVLKEAPAATRELEDGSIIYSVIREVPVVVTHYELIEEIHVRPRVKAFDRPLVMPLRREKIEVTRHASQHSGDSGD